MYRILFLLPVGLLAQANEFDQKMQNLSQLLDSTPQAAQSVAVGSTTPDFWGIAMRLGLSLLVVLALLYGLYYMARRVRKMDVPPSEGGRGLQILENYHVGSQQKLILLRLGENKVILVGATQDNLRTLAQLEGDEARMILTNSRNEMVTPTQFSETVNQMLSRFRREEKKE